MPKNLLTKSVGIVSEIESIHRNDTLSFWMDTLSSVVSDPLYAIDVATRQFCYVSSNDLFLCGHPVEDALESGGDFYLKITHPNDLSLWKTMHKAVLLYLRDSEKKPDEVDYFSCTFRLQRKYSFLARPLLQGVCYRMKPVWEGSRLRYLICSVRTSTTREKGKLQMYNKDGSTYEEYNTTTQRWRKKTIEPLTERERAILMLAQQGKNSGEIAGILYKGRNTIRNQIKSLFAKLNTHSMQETVELACRHGMIYPKPDTPSPSFELGDKRKRRPITQVKLQHIQHHLDEGKSIRQTAKLESTSESAIRYWVKQGKLKK